MEDLRPRVSTADTARDQDRDLAMARLDTTISLRRPATAHKDPEVMVQRRTASRRTHRVDLDLRDLLLDLLLDPRSLDMDSRTEGMHHRHLSPLMGRQATLRRDRHRMDRGRRGTKI